MGAWDGRSSVSGERHSSVAGLAADYSAGNWPIGSGRGTASCGSRGPRRGGGGHPDGCASFPGSSPVGGCGSRSRHARQFAGYAVSAGVLYLQDGPVLSAWDLTTATVTPGTQQASGVCLAAVNLVTRSTSGPEPVTDDQYAALFAGASDTGFSAPVVRARQLEGPAAFMVFVLAADGSVYAADDALDNVITRRYDTPGPLSLAIAETADPDDPGQVTCTLAYVTDNGGIMVLDTSRDAPAPAGSWPSSGSGPAAVAGPRIDGGVVWACDVFGAAIAACPLPAPTPPVFVAPGWNPARAALSFEVSSARQLVLLSGIQQRLLALPPGPRSLTGGDPETTPSRPGHSSGRPTVIGRRSRG